MTVHVDNNPEVGYLTRRERHGQGQADLYCMLTHEGDQPLGCVRAIPIPASSIGADKILTPEEDPITYLSLVATSEEFAYAGTYQRIKEGWSQITPFLVLPAGTSPLYWNYADLKARS